MAGRVIHAESLAVPGAAAARASAPDEAARPDAAGTVPAVARRAVGFESAVTGAGADRPAASLDACYHLETGGAAPEGVRPVPAVRAARQPLAPSVWRSPHEVSLDALAVAQLWVQPDVARASALARSGAAHWAWSAAVPRSVSAGSAARRDLLAQLSAEP